MEIKSGISFYFQQAQSFIKIILASPTLNLAGLIVKSALAGSLIILFPALLEK